MRAATTKLALVVGSLIAGSCAGAPESRAAAGPAGPSVAPAPSPRPAVDLVAIAPVQPAASAQPARIDGSTDEGRQERVAVVLEQIGALVAAEQYREALAAVDAALAAESAPPWAAARAALLRALGRREAALAQLDALVTEVGPAAMHPGLLFERAELAWVCGRRQAAETALTQLRRTHGGDPWLVRHARDLDGLSEELRQADHATRMRVVDLLGDLRGADAVEVRAAAFARAIEADADRAEGRKPGELRAKAVAIAAGDPEPILRALAVRHAELEVEALAEFCAAALADEDALVRSVAVQRTLALPRRVAAELLLAAMVAAPPAELHVQLHEALLLAGCRGPDLPEDVRTDASARARHAAAWRAAITDVAATGKEPK